MFDKGAVNAPATIPQRTKEHEVVALDFNGVQQTVGLTASLHFAGFIYREHREDGTPVAWYRNGELYVAANVVNATIGQPKAKPPQPGETLTGYEERLRQDG